MSLIDAIYKVRRLIFKLHRADALRLAAKNGKVDDLRACLDSGTDIDSRSSVRLSSTGRAVGFPF